MLKFGVVAMGVTAGLVALAPLASAQNQECSFTGTGGGDNNSVQGQCSSSGQRNFENNTFNGQPVTNPFDVFSNDVPIQDDGQDDGNVVNAQ